MTPQEVNAGLAVLKNYYAKDGKPHVLNDVQVAAYVDHLAPYSAAALETACKRWIATSKWFPAVSDLLEILRGPVLDEKAQAQLAWTTFERALRRAGVYAGATFANGAIGETARQVFGSWALACQFDLDSPGWTLRRQSFLALYPGIAARSEGQPVTLRGIAEIAEPVLIGPVAGLPLLPAAAPMDGPVGRLEAEKLVGDIRRRFERKRLSEGDRTA